MPLLAQNIIMKLIHLNCGVKFKGGENIEVTNTSQAEVMIRP